MHKRLQLSLAGEDLSLIEFAARRSGLTPGTFARSALLKAAREIETQTLSDWELQRFIITNLLREGCQTVEDLAASGLKREIVKAHLAAMVAAGQIEEGFAPSRYRTAPKERDEWDDENDEQPKKRKRQKSAKPRGTALFSLVGE